MDIDKDQIIRDVYYSPSGYGSMRQTLDDARKKEKSIKMEDVKKWFNQHVIPSTPSTIATQRQPQHSPT